MRCVCVWGVGEWMVGQYLVWGQLMNRWRGSSVKVYRSPLHNAKQHFLKLKLVVYIEIVQKRSDCIIKNFCLYFSMKISGWNLSD